MDAADRCAGCGLVVNGGTDACQGLFERLIARDFSDATYFTHHRLLVDTYCLQHPERYCVSFKSLAAHLMGVCWSLDHGGTRAVPHEPIRRWVERHPQLAKPPLPRARGVLTVADVAGAATPAEHSRRVDRWARATWAAYAPLHDETRRWVDAALNGTQAADRARAGRRS
jgi:hypothetical protein